MQSFSTVVLLGHLGDNPEIRTHEETSFATMRLAINTQWKKADKQYNATHWINVTVQGSLVNVVENYVHKGDPLLVRGELRTRQWKKDDKNYSQIYVVAREIKLLKPREKEAAELLPEPLDEAPLTDTEIEVEEAFAVDISTLATDDDVI